MKIGILGGTFNPIHMGHLVLAQECWYTLDLDKVVFVPAYIPPHKDIEDDVPVSDRLNMVRLALKGEDRFEISTYEIDKAGISYSVETIEHFRDKYGEDTELYFITGGDSATELSDWKDIDRILNMVNFVIATRPGWEENSPYDDKITKITIPEVDVSSTYIRERIKGCKPISYLVPGQVLDYIRNKGLYRNNI